MYNEIISKLKSELITNDKDVKKRINKAIFRLKQKDNINSVLSDLGVFDLDSLNSVNHIIKQKLPENILVKEVNKKKRKKREFTVIKMDKSKDLISIN
jgi:hypothetical protein